jgi:hypothetical protein
VNSAGDPALLSLEPEGPAVHGQRGLDGNWFPVPTVEDARATYVPEAPRDTLIYGRRGSDGTWQPVEGGAVWIGPNPPPDPVTPGTLWWRNDPDGTLYILYEDADSTQWVPASPGSGGSALENGLPPGGEIGQILTKRSATNFDAFWTPARSDIFTWSTRLTVLGDDLINPVAPRYIFTIPRDQLPNIPFAWIVSGNGIGTFFAHNIGLGAVGPSYPSSAGMGPFVEVGFNTNVWISCGGLPWSTLNVPDEVVVKGGSTNRVFHYNPVTDGGIRIGYGMYGGTSQPDPFPSATINFGIEGQILALEP